MWKKGIYKLLAILIFLAIVASSVVVFSAADLEEEVSEKGIAESGGNGVISLAEPSFVSAASASGGGGAFPEDEAGIAAYIFTNRTISIEKIKLIFSSVVEVGDNYIIGITPIPDYGGDINVHVYADTDGWLVAYLEMDEPAAAIMQWGSSGVDKPSIGAISTTLEDALIKAGEAATVGIVKSKIKYYDFEFPNANGMMIFVQTRTTDGSNICQVEIPEDYMLFEASYYYYIYYYSNRKGKYSYEHSSDYRTYWASSLWVKEVSTENWVKINVASTSYQGNDVYKWWRAFDSYNGEITPGTLYTIWVSYSPKERDGKSTESAVDKGSAGVATVLIYRTA